MGMDYTIDYLADHEAFAATLAGWHHEEWAYLRPGDTVEARLDRLRGEIGHRQIPTTVIAFEGKRLLGSAMLLEHDMDIHMEWTPWLASVFTAPAYRRQGIATALIGRIVEEARALDVGKLYLYTPSAAPFYARLGWSTVEKTVYHHTPVVIMSYDTASIA